jgi:predicted O-linked N-acetylglucosamine transferase (SPINDLY family)
MTTMVLDWHPDIYHAVVKQDYAAVAQYYEDVIANNSHELSHYWYLGLSYLLGQEEEAAQATWFSPMMEATESEIETWTWELVQVLNAEAQRLHQHPELSWLIRGHLREIAPQDFLNQLRFVTLSLQLYPFHPDDLTQWALFDHFGDRTFTPEEEREILPIFQKILEWPEPTEAVSNFVDHCFAHVLEPYPFTNAIWVAATDSFYGGNGSGLPIHLAELGLKHIPNHLDLLGALTDFYIREERYEDAIVSAQKFYENCTTLDLKILGASLVIKGYLNSGNFQDESLQWRLTHQNDIQTLIDKKIDNLSNNMASILATNLVNISYFKDRLSEDYQLQNQLVSLCEYNLQMLNAEKFNRYQLRHNATSNSLASTKKRKLKVGYLSKSLRYHSVGWLSRWLFKHHNQDEFDLSIYMLQFAPDEFTSKYFTPYVRELHNMRMQPAVDVAEKIFEDEIDILIDLDSQTSLQSINILALRPAPVQATWLGWDNTSLSSVDYFIADPYVLPESAQDYYPEKIVRLPQTYVAVEGFEIGVPTLRRDHFGIPADAVVYLSAQKGCKRHPDHIRSQLKVLKGVPGSYFLVKGLADEVVIQNLFAQIAEDEGVDFQRIQFLPRDADEETHRANLQIADIILDTFPYNGATTTLEVLWLGIPLVTRVGNQFSARNSYGFLKNAGIDAGIAWTDEEYVDWGIRFGLDRELREQVSWQLRKSRQSAPLWNAKQFTQAMEQAYQSMWQEFLATNH